MHQQRSIDDRKNIVCVDSYEDGVLKGRFYDSREEMEHFSSLAQFLLRMEALMRVQQPPQGQTFFEMLQAEEEKEHLPSPRRGTRATFEIQVLFRQHTSWQGTLLWLEQQTEHSFRSVLELVMLMDSALRAA